MKKHLYMETTEIPAAKTAMEVQAELVKSGASYVSMDYINGKLSGMHWAFKINGNDARFRMPARVDPVYVFFCKRDKKSNTGRTGGGAIIFPSIYDKAERVAWRQLLRWVQAQNSLLETGMVEAAEVFTAYIVPPGQDNTLFQIMKGREFLALPAPQS